MSLGRPQARKGQQTRGTPAERWGDPSGGGGDGGRRTTPAPALTSTFVLGSLPVTTEEERVRGLAAEALLGRRDTGGGRPVRLRSTPSELPSGLPEGPLAAREPFMEAEQALSRQETQWDAL